MMAASETTSTTSGDQGGRLEEPPSKKARMNVERILVWNIFVNIPTGSTTTLAVNSKSTCWSVKMMIEAREGYPQNEQILMSDGQELIDTRLLTDYNLQAGSIIRLACGMQIVVRTVDGKGIILQVNGFTLIEDVKALILGRVGIELHLQKLKHNGVTLMDGTTLDESRNMIYSWDTLHLS
jgi:hypothetical protein